LPLLTDLYTVGNSIDTFAPGHYARVYEATDKRDGAKCAFKVLRPEHMAGPDGQPRMEATAFINEADLLVRMSISPHVMRLLDCGYLAAHEEQPQGGEIESYGLNIDLFRQGSFRFAGRGWRPYLSLEPLPRSHSLLYVMKPNSPGSRWRLPTEEALDFAHQFVRVLKDAHRQKIVYLDHKLEHVYWDGQTLKVIDWNSSRLIENSPHVLAQQVTADLTNLCVGILYPILTGLSAKKGSLVAQPADQAGVEARYSDVHQLDFAAEPSLSQPMQELLQKGAHRQWASVEAFAGGLSRAAADFGWNTFVSDQASRLAREHTREGLAHLRAGHEQLKTARDLLREAAITDGLNEAFEAELRRVLNKINEMLSYRAVP
jgi:serine/threonine protein kinase